jgi:predicted nucleic acid-binding protein
LSPPTVDTRFFLTHFLAESRDLKQKTARKIVELQRESAIVPTIVIHEVYKFVSENRGFEVADLRLNSILNSTFKLVELQAPIAVTSAKLRVQHRGLPTADSIIAATALEAKSRRVISDDPHFSKIEAIKLEWI